jgi:hypothetical protein
LEEHGLEVVSHGRLENVTNIYDETYSNERPGHQGRRRGLFVEAGLQKTLLEAIQRALVRYEATRERNLRFASLLHALNRIGPSIFPHCPPTT